MRNNEVRKGRQCLRPEVCRTFNFGEHGASKGQFFKDYLVRIKLNHQMVDWAHQDLGCASDGGIRVRPP
jgi:alpha-1,3-mannosyl-glycoprotein beta-1,2-N-acetylglucosaminyltransferase